MQTNAVNMLEGKLVTHACLVNGKKVDMIRDTGALLVRIQCTATVQGRLHWKYVKCNPFGWTKERYTLVMFDVCSSVITRKLIAAVLPDPRVRLILGNIDRLKECDEKEAQD